MQLPSALPKGGRICSCNSSPVLVTSSIYLLMSEPSLVPGCTVPRPRYHLHIMWGVFTAHFVRLMQAHLEDTVFIKINWEENKDIARTLDIKVGTMQKQSYFNVDAFYPCEQLSKLMLFQERKCCRNLIAVPPAFKHAFLQVVLNEHGMPRNLAQHGWGTGMTH
eukprot:1161127-Pelagomonas_calceolata.AAC.5